MSLAGTLSELELIELLQMIGLSRKSGVLEIHGRVDSAWLALRDGAVTRVARTDWELDAKVLLEAEGLTPGTERAVDLLAQSALDAVLELLTWRQGRFWFRAAADPADEWDAPEGLVLEPGLSAEFLALERARIDDEDPRPTAEFAGTSLPRVLIAMDPDLALLERIKHEFQGAGLRVHIFQDAADGLARLKDYLVRGEFPAIVMGADLPSPAWSEPRSGWREIAQRIRRMAPRTSIVLLAGPERREGLLGIDAVVARPDVARASAAELREFMEMLGSALSRAS
jgi:hypothetical protein